MYSHTFLLYLLKFIVPHSSPPFSYTSWLIFKLVPLPAKLVAKKQQLKDQKHKITWKIIEVKIDTIRHRGELVHILKDTLSDHLNKGQVGSLDPSWNLHKMAQWPFFKYNSKETLSQEEHTTILCRLLFPRMTLVGYFRLHLVTFRIASTSHNWG